MTVDLHIHTTASDGTLTPYEVVEKASKIGLKAIAITDHDTVDGLDEGFKAAKKFNITFIPGVELSCDLKGIEVHILGYCLDYKNEFFQKKLELLQNERRERALEIIKKISTLGYYITYEKVLKHANGSSLGRVHIAQALIESGYFKNVQQAFESLLGNNCPGYVPRKKLLPSEAVKIIKIARGVPVLAHPVFLPSLDIVEEIIKLGIKGIEVYYPAHESSTVINLLQISKKYNLICTGGSDFHGEYRGSYLGQCAVSDNVIEQLYKLKDI